MNIIVSQWRKFELKRSYIFKDIDYWFFWIFSGIYFDFYEFNSFKKWQKGGLISTEPAELTWRDVGPARMRHDTQGHVAAPSGPTRWGGTNAW